MANDPYKDLRKSMPPAPPTDSTVRNQGGMPAPMAHRPRPYVPSPPETRARKDSVVRPVATPISPGAQPGALQAAPAPPAPPVQGTVQGQAPGLIKTEVTQPDGSKITTEGPPGTQAQQVASAQVQEAEQSRAEDMAESPVRGVPMGTFKQVANEGNAPAESTPEQRERWVADSTQQLQQYGKYPGAGDPNAPAPPIRPFGRSFNPFTNTWTGGGPEVGRLLGFDFDQVAQEYIERAKGGG